MQENTIKVLTDREQILQRPGMYCGSVAESSKLLLLLRDGKFVYEEQSYVEGLLKIIDEIIDNSIDEFIRTNGKYANVINIAIRPDCVKIDDNGRGLPQGIINNRMGNDLPQGVIAFTQARAGSNFSEDTKANGIGTNGVGSFLTNVLSSEFIVETNNGSHTLSIRSIENCSKFDYKIAKKKSKSFTTVYFKPDFKQFEVDKISEIYEEIIINRLQHIVQCYNITFNIDGIKNKIKINSQNTKTYLSKFNDDIVYIEDSKYTIGVYVNEFDEFKFTSYVNGLYMKRGGNNINYIMNILTSKIKEKLKKKYKDISEADIKNKLSLVCIMTEFENVQFDSQTKETMTNSKAELKKYFNEKQIEELATKITSNKAIIENITLAYTIKENILAKKNLKKADVIPKHFKHEKYMPAIKQKKYLVLMEGTSAKNAITPVLGRDIYGFVELRGVIMNVFTNSDKNIIGSEVITLMRNVMNISLSEKKDKYNYENILIATDADMDGIKITSIILAFLYKYTNMIQNGQVFVLDTPIAVVKYGGKPVDYIFNFSDLTNIDSKYEVDYKKGLGSWCEGGAGKKGELTELIDDYGIENFMRKITGDDFESMLKWLSNYEDDYINFRKDEIIKNEVDIVDIMD